MLIGLRFDWILIRDGNNNDAPPLGKKMCGSKVPQPIFGSGNELFIQFHSGDVPHKGFQIQLKDRGMAIEGTTYTLPHQNI